MAATTSSKISRIVRIRQMLFRWRKKAALSSSSPPPDVPAGHVAVYVGSGSGGGCSRRFVVPARYLNHAVFQKLLVQAEEEYGFANQGPLTIPCDVAAFEEVLQFVVAAEGGCSTAVRHMSSEDFQSCSLERHRRIRNLENKFAESRPLIGGAGSQ